MSYTNQSAHANKDKSYRYFRQYRNPGQDASGKNGMYGHPMLQHLLPYYHRRYTVYRTPKVQGSFIRHILNYTGYNQ